MGYLAYPTFISVPEVSQPKMPVIGVQLTTQWSQTIKTIYHWIARDVRRPEVYGFGVGDQRLSTYKPITDSTGNPVRS